MTSTPPAPSREQRRQLTRGRILEAARKSFAAAGYERTTIRAVASAAGVDPALVIQHFTNKEELFRSAVTLSGDETETADSDRVVGLLLDVLGVKMAKVSGTSLALLRSMLTYEEAADLVRTAQKRQVEMISSTIPTDDAELRSSMVMAVLLGVTIARHLLELDALRDASAEEIADLLRPCFVALTQRDGTAAPEAQPEPGGTGKAKRAAESAGAADQA